MSGLEHRLVGFSAGVEAAGVLAVVVYFDQFSAVVVDILAYISLS